MKDMPLNPVTIKRIQAYLDHVGPLPPPKLEITVSNFREDADLDDIAQSFIGNPVKHPGGADFGVILRTEVDHEKREIVLFTGPKEEEDHDE